jgi:hypothetical protein
MRGNRRVRNPATGGGMEWGWLSPSLVRFPHWMQDGEAEEVFKSDDAVIAAWKLSRIILRWAMPLPLGGLRSKRIS